MLFSANLGFLWTELSLPQAIRAAGAARFDAVECHWPFEVPAAEVVAALQDTGLPMLGINTRRGEVAAGENGLAAVPARKDAARAAIDEAIAYAVAIGARYIHVMAGVASGKTAHQTFVQNLRYASASAAAVDKVILIEPLNPFDAPGYFLRTTDQAAELIAEVGADNLKLMFDCYHVQRVEGKLASRLRALFPLIGHIQFAGVPDRGPPDEGEVDYADIFSLLDELGYRAPLGAEYRPNGPTEASMGWMAKLRGA